MVRAARAADADFARARAAADATGAQPSRVSPSPLPAPSQRSLAVRPMPSTLPAHMPAMLAPTPPVPPSIVPVGGLDVRAMPFQPCAAHVSVEMAIGIFRAELMALASAWRPSEQPRRTGGRQRRAARERGRSRPVCFVGPAQAARRFEEAATARGWLAIDGSDTEYMSAEEGE